MRRLSMICVCFVALWAFLDAAVRADAISGHYMEARTCQVYVGPCFANGESGLSGKEGVMAWHILSGSQADVDLAGLKVIVVVQASDTLGFQGIEGVKSARSMVFVDESASPQQRQALVDFAKKNSGKAGRNIAKVTATPIDMQLNTSQLAGRLTAGRHVELVTRKANPDDCICANHTAYYAPLASVEHFAAGVAIQGEVSARALGSRWSTPGARSAYMATFSYE